MKKVPNKKILMIWTANNHEEMGGVGYYRIHNPGVHLKELGYDIDIVAGYEIVDKFHKNKDVEEAVDVWSNILSTYDLVWMKHTDNEVALAGMFGLRDKFKCKIVWDFDDDLFNVRPTQPAYKEYHPQSKNRALVSAAIAHCDAITVSTVPLKKSLSKLLKDVYGMEKDIYICPNFVNTKEWNKVKYHPNKQAVIGYYGSTTHNDDLDIVMPAIFKILQKHPLVKFQIMGAMGAKDSVKMFAKTPDIELLRRCELIAGTSGWAGFPNTLLNKNWDIAIAPLVDDIFNQCKSNIKWMETAMKGIPCVCSDVSPYSDSVKKNTGILCSDSDWFNKLDKLVSDAEYRTFIGKNARKHVIDNWSAEVIVPKWKDTLDKLLKS
jgi:glycosyltransferase involved in cell wall biosynthesis